MIIVNMYACVCSVAQSCSVLWDPMHYRPPGSSVHGISLARILEWVAVSSYRDLPYRGSNLGFLHCRQILYHWAIWEVCQTHLADLFGHRDLSVSWTWSLSPSSRRGHWGTVWLGYTAGECQSQDSKSWSPSLSPKILLFLKRFIFIWLYWVIIVACGLFCCSMQDLVP